MKFELTKPRLWFLFSIAGYTYAEIAGFTYWSSAEMKNCIAKWNLPGSHELLRDGTLQLDLRRELDAVRRKDEDKFYTMIDDLIAPLHDAPASTS